MQYMHFNSSCAFCCVANLLELKGRKVSDEELFQFMRADILLGHEEKSSAWQTGAMLQSGRWFDLALHPMGLHLEERTATQEEIIYVLPVPFMVGLRMTGRGRHAMVLLAREKDMLTFLNPHKEGDGEEDIITLSCETCTQRLEPYSMVGHLTVAEGETVDFVQVLNMAKENWRQYQKELFSYIGEIHTVEDMRNAMDPLFRALLLDSLEGARICGHKEQEERLRTLQMEFLGALKQNKDLRLSEYLNGDELSEAFSFYHAKIKSLIQSEETE